MQNLLIHILFQIFICTKYINNLRLKKIAPIEVKRKGIVRQSIKREYDKEIRQTQQKTVLSTKDLEQFLIQPVQILEHMATTMYN